MLYFYKGKIYVKPFENKIVEVTIEKKGKEYDVKATENIEMFDKMPSELVSISLEEAYKMQNKKINFEEKK